MRKLFIALGLALLLAFAAVAQASAASRLVIRGAGFGHGIGMSQYGAYGLSLQGVAYRDILARYFTGTALGQLNADREVRVLLQGSKGAVRFTGAARVGDEPLSPDGSYSIVRGGQGLVLRDADGTQRFTSPPPMRVQARDGGALVLRGTSVPGVRDGRYRGALEVRPGARGVNAINAIDLENYVRGVVSAESPSAWPAEALKAQAVAARTYAITSRAGSLGDGFDQFADVRSQVYKGVAAETPTTDAAVAATRAQVVTFAGQPVTTYFFSTSGGHTENVENSFVGSQPKPWLKGVADPYDDLSPRHRWGPITMTKAQAGARLGRLVKGRFQRIKVLRRGTSPRIVRAEVVGSRGRTPVTGPRLRAAFRLNDTWAYFTSVTSGVKRRPPAATEPTPTTEGQAPTSGGIGPAGARAALAGRRTGGIVVSGRIEPARRGAWARLQRREGGTWRTVTDVVMGRGGRYAGEVPGAGTYRVVLGQVAGPAVVAR